DELAAFDGEPVERGDIIDVDQMGRFRKPERHGRNEALPAGQHAAVVAGDFREQRDRLVDRLRRMVAKRSGLHRAAFIGWYRLGAWPILLKRCTVSGTESKRGTPAAWHEAARILLSRSAPP